MISRLIVLSLLASCSADSEAIVLLCKGTEEHFIHVPTTKWAQPQGNIPKEITITLKNKSYKGNKCLEWSEEKILCTSVSEDTKFGETLAIERLTSTAYLVADKFRRYTEEGHVELEGTLFIGKCERIAKPLF